MDFELKPIRTLVKVAFYLHVASLFVVSILYFLQVPLMPLFGLTRVQESFLSLPFISFITIIIMFLLHCGLTGSFLSATGCENVCVKRLRIISILSFIYVIFVAWAINRVDYFVFMVVFRNVASDDMVTFSVLNNMIVFGLGIRSLALCALLSAASMSFYYCLIKKKENKDLLND